MAVHGGSTSNRRIGALMIVTIAVLAGASLLMFYRSSNHGPASDKEIALAVVKTVYADNAGAFQRLFSDNPYKANFVSTVSQELRNYGPVKEVSPAPDTEEVGSRCPGMSSWKVVADRGTYTVIINVKDGYLLRCDFSLPSGGFCTGMM